MAGTAIHVAEHPSLTGWARNGATRSGQPMRRAGWELPNGGEGKPAVLGPGQQGGEQLIGEGDINVWALPSNESGRMMTVFLTFQYTIF